MALAPKAIRQIPFDFVVTGNGGIVTADYEIPPGYYILGAINVSTESGGTAGGGIFLWLEYAQGGSTDIQVDGRCILNSTSSYSAGSGHSPVLQTPAQGFGRCVDGNLTLYVGGSVSAKVYRASGILVQVA